MRSNKLRSVFFASDLSWKRKQPCFSADYDFVFRSSPHNQPDINTSVDESKNIHLPKDSRIVCIVQYFGHYMCVDGALLRAHMLL